CCPFASSSVGRLRSCTFARSSVGRLCSCLFARSSVGRLRSCPFARSSVGRLPSCPFPRCSVRRPPPGPVARSSVGRLRSCPFARSSVGRLRSCLFARCLRGVRSLRARCFVDRRFGDGDLRGCGFDDDRPSDDVLRGGRRGDRHGLGGDLHPGDRLRRPVLGRGRRWTLLATPSSPPLLLLRTLRFRLTLLLSARVFLRRP